MASEAGDAIVLKTAELVAVLSGKISDLSVQLGKVAFLNDADAQEFEEVVIQIDIETGRGEFEII